MAQTWLIDPTTGDYMMTNGQPQQTNQLTVAAYIRLKAPRNGAKKRNGEPGGWMYAPDSKWGSTYWRIVGTRIGPQNSTQIENIGGNALQPLADTGRASSIDVTVTGVGRGTEQLQIDITQNNDQSQIIIPSLGI